jgi:prolyl 4-hydroxylase
MSEHSRMGADAVADADGAALPSEWASWLQLNVGRGCSAEDLLRDMLRGGIAEAAARRALGAAFAAAALVTASPRLPGIAADSPSPPVGDRPVLIVTRMAQPQICVIEEFLTAAECQRLLALGAATARPAEVVDGATGRSTLHAARRGSMAFLDINDPLVRDIERRLAQLVDWDPRCFEPMQVIGYAPGDEYRAHYDWFNVDDPGAARHLERGGQRVGTFLMYLDTPAAGGDTTFPQAGGLRVHARAGRAVWFRNVTADGRPDPLVLHSGEPVVQGEKHVCTVWLRAQPWRDERRDAPPAGSATTAP